MILRIDYDTWRKNTCVLKCPKYAKKICQAHKTNIIACAHKREDARMKEVIKDAIRIP